MIDETALRKAIEAFRAAHEYEGIDDGVREAIATYLDAIAEESIDAKIAKIASGPRGALDWPRPTDTQGKRE